MIASSIGRIIDYIWPGEMGSYIEAGSVAGCAKAVRPAASHALFSRGQVRSGFISTRPICKSLKNKV